MCSSGMFEEKFHDTTTMVSVLIWGQYLQTGMVHVLCPCTMGMATSVNVVNCVVLGGW